MFSAANVARILLTVCGLAGFFWPTPGTAQEVRLQSEFFPLKKDAKWYYKVGNQTVVEKVDGLVSLDIKTGDKIDKVPAYRMVVTRKDQELTEFIAVLADGIYRYAGDDKEITPPLCILKLPLQPTWKCSVPVAGAMVEGTFTWKMDNVTVPLQKDPIAAVLVTGEFKVGAKTMTTQTWFAAGIGIVKKQRTFGKDVNVMELEKFEAGK